MKLIIQIPCFNEEKTLPETLGALPKTIEGIDEIEVLIINDGSIDQTEAVARSLGVAHLVHFAHNRGLAKAFSAGIDAALQAGADIIVNTDADNQYRGEDICRLVEPILRGRADIVVGDRGVEDNPNFSPIKRQLQRLGSWLVQHAAGIAIPDAASGFRAFSREAAQRMIVLSDYSYVLETLIQAGARRLKVEYVPIRINKITRPSRLIRSLPEYLLYSAITVARTFMMYQPMRFFFGLGSLFFLAGFILGIRFLFYYAAGLGSGHIQSLILAAILIIVSFQVGLIGLAADLIAFNRKMMEEVLFRLKRAESAAHKESSR